MSKPFLLIQTPQRHHHNFKTQYLSNQYVNTQLVTQYSKQKISTNIKSYNSQNIDNFSPKKRSKSLSRSSTSKLKIFQNAKNVNKQQRQRSHSVKLLNMNNTTNSFNNTNNFNTTNNKKFSNTTNNFNSVDNNKPTKSKSFQQNNFLVPKKNTKHQSSNVINEKKTVQDIMNRLKNKNSIKLHIKKQIQVKGNQQINQKANQYNNLQQILIPQIIINNKQKQLTQQNQQQIIKLKTILQEKTKNFQQKSKNFEQKSKNFQQKTKYLQKVQNEMGKKINQVQTMMSSFQQTVKRKQQQFMEKQQLLKMKEIQIQEKIKQKTQNIIQSYLLKNNNNIVSKLNNIQNQHVSLPQSNNLNQISNNYQYLPANQTNNILQSKSQQKTQPKHQQVVKPKTINQTMIQTKQYIQNSNKMQINIIQTKDQPLNQKSINYHDTQSVNLQQIQSINFAPKQKPQDKKTINQSKKSNKQIKQVKQPIPQPPILRKDNPYQNSFVSQVQSKQIITSKSINSSQINNQKIINKPPQLPKLILKNPIQNVQKPKQTNKPSAQTNKQQPANQTKSRKGSMAQSNKSSRSKQDQQAKKKKKQQKQKVINQLNRMNQLIYFIGQIPHHCSNNMKKKKNFSFKLASLYLLKYVYDKFRSLQRMNKQLLKKNIITKQYIQQKKGQNDSIKQTYQKMKSYVYKKQPYPPQQSQKYLNQESQLLCCDSQQFIKNYLFKQIKQIIEYYEKSTKGKWNDHQVNICYYRMFIAVFIIQELQFGMIVLQAQQGKPVDYMLSQIQSYNEQQLRQRMSQCYQIFTQLQL